MAIADTTTTASTSMLSKVRSSCETLLQHDACSVRVNMDAISAFVEELDWDRFEELAAPQRFPLNFKSQEDEVAFLTLLALLNFGSGYRTDLHKYCQRGASETILFGLIGLYISVPHLNADWMRNVSIDVLANYFSIPMDRDEELSPGIYVSKPGLLRAFVEMIYKSIHTCGEKLQDVGYTTMGTFVMAHLRKEANDPPSAVYLVEQLVSTFSAFEDHQTIRSTSCYFLKRAQLVVVSLYRRFHGENPAFAFTDMEAITALSDNVLPCVLRAMNILEYQEDLASHIDRGELLPTGEWECEIRAGAIVACDAIVQASKGRLTVWTLDKYLWSIGKEPRFCELQRHQTRNTLSY